MLRTLSAAVILLSLAFHVPAARPTLPNERFAESRTGVSPVQLRDYEAMQENMSACLRDNKLDTGTCQHLKERMGSALLQALINAHVLNKLASPDEPKFCDSHGEGLVLQQKYTEATLYSMFLVSDRVKYGSGIYGSGLSSTYLAKLVYDQLLDTEPCKAAKPR